MRPATEIVKQVMQTEKGTRQGAKDQYLLRVALDANKVQIRQAVEELFKVKVQGVNTARQHGKWRRLSAQRGQRPAWKKAFVTVAKGQKIEAVK